MKLIKLSNELLKYMVKSYFDNHIKTCSFSTCKSLYPKIDDSFISDALYLLKNDGFVSIFPADDVAYITSLKLDAIRNSEEDTFLKKGYTVLKELHSWF